jgi:hypothetical protein
MRPPDPLEPPDDSLSEPLEWCGVRTIPCRASTLQDLAAQVATVISEHAHDDDEVQLSYSAVQAGWQEHPVEPAHAGAPASTWTQLFFEYSALILLRPRPASAE